MILFYFDWFLLRPIPLLYAWLGLLVFVTLVKGALPSVRVSHLRERDSYGRGRPTGIHWSLGLEGVAAVRHQVARGDL